MLFLHSEELSGLCKVWDWDPEYAETLKEMGYGTTLLLIVTVPFDFSIREFAVDNGCEGKMPVTMKEWIKVGVWRKEGSSATSDGKAYALMKFLYSIK